MAAFAKIFRGIVKYQNSPARAQLVQKMARKPPAPQPHAVMVNCVDARLRPIIYTGTEDEDNVIFVLRNPGNLVVPQIKDASATGSTELAGLELLCAREKLHHIFVCGHSSCKAMEVLYKTDRSELQDQAAAYKHGSPLNVCLHHAGYPSLQKLDQFLKNPQEPLKFIQDMPKQAFQAFIDQPEKDSDIQAVVLPQINCLQQMENVTTHEFLANQLREGVIKLHGIFHSVESGDTMVFDKKSGRFVLPTEDLVEEVIAENS